MTNFEMTDPQIAIHQLNERRMANGHNALPDHCYIGAGCSAMYGFPDECDPVSSFAAIVVAECSTDKLWDRAAQIANRNASLSELYRVLMIAGSSGMLERSADDKVKKNVEIAATIKILRRQIAGDPQRNELRISELLNTHKPRVMKELPWNESNPTQSGWYDLHTMSFDDMLGYMESSFRGDANNSFEPLRADRAPQKGRESRHSWFYQNVIEWFKENGLPGNFPRQAIVESCDAILRSLDPESAEGEIKVDSHYKTALTRASD